MAAGMVYLAVHPAGVCTESRLNLCCAIAALIGTR
jgi:hypothetical protein